MKAFQLKLAAVLQGSFSLKELNLIVVFQVNCPGCFFYALPLANELHQRYHERGLNVLGLSTAFEDFEFNNEKNTRLLLQDGILVGETKRAMEKMHVHRLPYTIHFPVAMDLLGAGDALYHPSDIEQICQTNTDFRNIEPLQKNRIRLLVQQHVLTMGLSSYTFTVNQLEGTPSWVLFHKNGTILEQWFGHRSKDDVLQQLAKYLPTT